MNRKEKSGVKGGYGYESDKECSVMQALPRKYQKKEIKTKKKKTY